MAAPHVAGIAALARSFKPGLAPATVIASIERASARTPRSRARSRPAESPTQPARSTRSAPASPPPARAPPPATSNCASPGKRVKIRGKRGIVRFSWSKASDTDLIGYDVIVNGKVRAQVKGTHARIKVPAGKWKWSVVAIDAEGNTTTAMKSSSSNGRISVLNTKKKRRRARLYIDRMITRRSLTVLFFVVALCIPATASGKASMQLMLSPQQRHEVQARQRHRDVPRAEEVDRSKGLQGQGHLQRADRQEDGQEEEAHCLLGEEGLAENREGRLHCFGQPEGARRAPGQDG